MAGWVLCMTLVLAALAGAAGETRYQKFLRQHVDNSRTSMPGTQRYCDTMMARRGMTTPTCKITNTFVHAPATALVAACSQPPNASGFHSTLQALSLTVCRLRGRNTQPSCTYRAQSKQQHVLVSCWGRLPVHLETTI